MDDILDSLYSLQSSIVVPPQVFPGTWGISPFGRDSYEKPAVCWKWETHRIQPTGFHILWYVAHATVVLPDFRNNHGAIHLPIFDGFWCERLEVSSGREKQTFTDTIRFSFFVFMVTRWLQLVHRLSLFYSMHRPTLLYPIRTSGPVILPVDKTGSVLLIEKAFIYTHKHITPAEQWNACSPPGVDLCWCDGDDVKELSWRGGE